MRHKQASPTPKPITRKQERVLELIEEHIRRDGIPPTINEIRAKLRFRSSNAVRNHLNALEKKGFIKRVQHTARGIMLTASSRCPYCGAQMEKSARYGARLGSA